MKTIEVVVCCLLSVVFAGCLTTRYNSIVDDGVNPPTVAHHSVYVGVMPDDQPIMAAAQAKATMNYAHAASAYYGWYGTYGMAGDFRAPSERVNLPATPPANGETVTQSNDKEIMEARRRADAALKTAQAIGKEVVEIKKAVKENSSITAVAPSTPVIASEAQPSAAIPAFGEPSAGKPPTKLPEEAATPTDLAPYNGPLPSSDKQQ